MTLLQKHLITGTLLGIAISAIYLAVIMMGLGNYVLFGILKIPIAPLIFVLDICFSGVNPHRAILFITVTTISLFTYWIIICNLLIIFGYKYGCALYQLHRRKYNQAKEQSDDHYYLPK
ncbi:hypothetical protein JD969_09590 [Planctomycetota bacterium]|nr:hypothetical protein JD969_09590 [Planctomycetota bacterium]